MTKNPIIVGLPYEHGMYWRKGAKHGPTAVREFLRKLRGISVYSEAKIPYDICEIDQGDLALDSYDALKALRQIEEAVIELLKAGHPPICIGGDHTVTLAIIRAYKKFYGKGRFGIIHLDAHSDTFASVDGFKYHHGAVFRNIVEEELVDPTKIIQMGLRGQVREGGLDFIRQRGFGIVKIEEFRQSNFNLENHIENKSIPYYVSIDIDVIDPAYAPGTGTPVPGGLTSWEILHIVRQLSNFKIIGLDLVEVSPQYDTSNITALLASHIIFECLSSIEFTLI
jgi:agmatinase